MIRAGLQDVYETNVKLVMEYWNDPSTSYLQLVEHIIVVIAVFRILYSILFPREGARRSLLHC